MAPFVRYQTDVGLRAIAQKPNADLAMIYIEEPDGFEHQFLLTDPRQATNPSDPTTIGAGQDQAKVARYANYVQSAYQAADAAVQSVIQTVGTDANGVPRSDVIVVSDHGFDPFYTSVSINNFLSANGFSSNEVRAVASGPAVNFYINLAGREPNGIVSQERYLQLQQQLKTALQGLVDSNPNYDKGSPVSVFDKIYTRPAVAGDPNFGLETAPFIGQDSGDVFALLTDGYNFDGVQSPPVIRLGDPVSSSPILSVPNFYGAHGYDPTIPDMSAIFFAAGPDFGHGTLSQISNIDVTPTIEDILNVPPASTVDGQPINRNP